MKNSKVNRYDAAYPENLVNDTDNIDFVTQIRETFFSILKPYLVNLEDYIDTKTDPNQANFYKYFNKKGYLDNFDLPAQKEFAQKLMESSQFIHFCDDFFSDELNNFQMLHAILKSRGEIHSNNDQRRDTYIPGDETRAAKQKWPEQDPVVFNFRMPADH